MIVKCIPPEWLRNEGHNVIEGILDESKFMELNAKGYGIYYYPNHPSKELYSGGHVDGTQVDVFNLVFVDMDVKDGTYTKEAFIEKVKEYGPSIVVDSGNGIHAYWQVKDLDAMSFLRLSRRFMRLLNTDPAVQKICQVMRLPGTMNTKNKDNYIPCDIVHQAPLKYTSEELHKMLPTITMEDEDYCKTHYDRIYNSEEVVSHVNDSLPSKFGDLLLSNKEVKDLWLGTSKDRSRGDFKLARIMRATGFTEVEARTVLIQCQKAEERPLVHRLSYANNMIDKLWSKEKSETHKLSKSVAEILAEQEGKMDGVRFQCHTYVDDTVHGFHLGEVLGLVAGSGVGKTTFALNMFKWFAEFNPDYHHFFIPLEQPELDIARRWVRMCGDNVALHDKVHVVNNYEDNGMFRHLTFEQIKKYIKDWQETNKAKVGCVVIDHIGALSRGSTGEHQELMDICHSMKAFAIETKTFLIMQSQTTKGKGQNGDVELNKDAAYGTMYFEAYCDYLVTIWQPLKKCHSEDGCPVVTAFKFCKIRDKNIKQDRIKEETPYLLNYDIDTECFSHLTQDQWESFKFFRQQADRKKTNVNSTEYTAIGTNGTTDNNKSLQ